MLTKEKQKKKEMKIEWTSRQMTQMTPYMNKWINERMR